MREISDKKDHDDQSGRTKTSDGTASQILRKTLYWVGRSLNCRLVSGWQEPLMIGRSLRILYIAPRKMHFRISGHERPRCGDTTVHRPPDACTGPSLSAPSEYENV
ncbi:hypothetical protein CMQ_6928 [Grosmannia clavigera kw1407]|uniref:Uncharacterized protein n=1 Tax=Grosmannia clavigera (strain kw1407 / UAMH 11150) TaxID=655863 RepID=F0X6R7_GROCL|nr:uncharacterized protein CMQ_6928 [Grosmannia clavigera kw1407]EFX06607.1 hypothetical protein CMQ_6928 [Grosmannia clavigera kw1407]